jgi:2-oxoglutarate dehydrogenase E2 component (dihydrolipoamide succinyltransferase)
MKKIEIQVPSLGESITEATVAKWFFKKGNKVKKDDILLELETDKVSQEIYAADSGTLLEVFYQEGDDVNIGDTLCSIQLLGQELANKDKEEEKKVTNNHENKKTFSEVIVPSLGESITEATIGKWMKSLGQEVFKGEPLVEIETDKVTQELYAEDNGIMKELLFKEQEEVKIGEVIAILELKDTLVNSKKEFSDESKDNEEKRSISKIPTETKSEPEILDNDLDPTAVKRTGIGNKVTMLDLIEFSNDLSFSPAAKKNIREKNVNINDLQSANRVTKADSLDSLKNFSKKGNKAFNELPESTDNVKPLSKLRQSIASRLKQAQNTAAMLTTFNEIDMFKIIEIRKKYKDKFLDKYGVKLGFMSLFTKAAIIVLKEIPEINAEIKESSIIYKNRYDIGIAVGTERGLYVPVIRNADKMSFADIESEILKYGKMAKENKLTMEHMKDGTFTISNGGVYGSMLSTPILNAPQSGILGLHNIVKRPWVVNGQIEIRPIMYVALTYDHRIVDGKEAVTFLVRVKEIIENPEQMMFDL